MVNISIYQKIMQALVLISICRKVKIKLEHFIKKKSPGYSKIDIHTE